VGGFRTDADDSRSIVSEADIIKQQAAGTAEGCASMVGGILRGIREDRRE
jgi:hypothetical protein